MAQSGYTPILIYASGTATNVPLAANMTSSASGAELAVNYADGKLYYKNSSGVVTLLASAAGASGDVVGPSSATNNALARFDTTTGKLIKNSVGILSDAGVLTGLTGLTSSGSITFSSLTSGRVPYATTAGLLTDSANLLYSGTDLTVYGITVGRGGGAQATNTAVGVNALVSNTTGNQNTAIGYSAGGYSTATQGLTYVGYQAGNTNVTGSRNTAIGWNAGYTDTTSFNVFVGSRAGYLANGGQNTAVGDYALSSVTGASTGTCNVAMGQGTLQYNTSGSNNTGLGMNALQANTTADGGTAVGRSAGYSNTTGVRLTALGREAGYSNTTGNNNTFIGAATGYGVTTGGGNTFVGTLAANSAAGCGYYMTTGNNNTIIGGFTGNQGGLDIRTASNYIVLSDGDGNPRAYWNNSGYGYVNGSASALGIGDQWFNINGTGGSSALLATSASGNNASAALFLAASTTGYTANIVDIRTAMASGTGFNAITYRSDTSTTRFNVAGNGNVTNTNNSYGAISDIKLKENIVDATPKLADLMQVKVRNYNLKSDPEHKQLGVIAQELEQVFPSMVEEVPDRDAEGNDLGTTTKQVKYSVFVPMLIKAIQELKAEIDQLKGN